MSLTLIAAEKLKLTLDTDIRYLKGVGPKKEAKFIELGARTIKELLYYFPFRYEDRRNIKKIKDITEEEFMVVRAKIIDRKLKKIPYFARHRSKVRDILEAVVDDDSGCADIVWFNQGYLFEKLEIGQEIVFYGKPRREGNRWQFNSPEYEINAPDSSLNIDRIVGVYRLPRIFTQKFIRAVITAALEQTRAQLNDSLPFSLRQERNLPNIIEALHDVHFPASLEAAENARRRFIFEELFFSQILVYLRKAKHCQTQGISLRINLPIIEEFKQNLGFELTRDQQSAIDQILSDIVKPFPMRRLLQGDVGCGKTVVAAIAALTAADNGYQTALMVPTEVLAYQHAQTLLQMFKFLGKRVEFLVSSLPKIKISQIYSDLAAGKIDIIVGTHALLSEQVEFKKLALTIIDEQHKFGVAQRALLPKKGIPSPHCLVMSATPIPRSLALSLYGDLDLSMIKQMPVGRKPPENKLIAESQRDQAYSFIAEKLKEGRQVYMIYPLIDESENEELKSLTAAHRKITKLFSRYKTAIFHSRMKTQEKMKVIEDFRNGQINILLSTTVVEVGVNVENASLMAVENPERFGLAQLHQLRGRIQRSNYQPYFILLTDRNLPELARLRLKAIVENNDGFVIAEEDLKLRGPGDFFGQIQHGLPDLKIANPLRDIETLKLARVYAYKLIKQDFALALPQNRCVRRHLNFWFSEQDGDFKSILTNI